MRRCRRQAFSLIELVMVVVIIALVGAIAIPRLSRGSAGAAASALMADLEAMNKAIDLYAAEHGGRFPDADSAADELTMFTDDSGGTSTSADSTHLFGPYLRVIPPLPSGARIGNTGISDSDGEGVGWIYDASSGLIQSNSASGPIPTGGSPFGSANRGGSAGAVQSGG